MSDKILYECDCCKAIIAGHPAKLEVKVISRPRPLQEEENHPLHKIDLCSTCDLQVARVLLPLLPSLAYALNPNCATEVSAP